MMKLICSGETYSSGTAISFRSTFTPLREVSRGIVLAVDAPDARLLPNKDTISPAAGGWLPKLAAFTTPPAVTIGEATIEKAKAVESPPPGAGLTTEISADPN